MTHQSQRRSNYGIPRPEQIISRPEAKSVTDRDEQRRQELAKYIADEIALGRTCGKFTSEGGAFPMLSMRGRDLEKELTLINEVLSGSDWIGSFEGRRPSSRGNDKPWEGDLASAPLIVLVIRPKPREEHSQYNDTIPLA